MASVRPIWIVVGAVIAAPAAVVALDYNSRAVMTLTMGLNAVVVIPMYNGRAMSMPVVVVVRTHRDSARPHLYLGKGTCRRK